MDSKFIVFRAYNAKRQMPIRLSPLENKSGKLYTGQGEKGFYEFLTKQEKEELGYIIDRNTKVTINDGKVLDMDDPIDAANWKWIQKHPYIAIDRYEGEADNDAVYFVDNPQKEAEIKVSKDKKISQTKAKMYNLATAKKTELAKALGNPGAESMSVERIEEWLSMHIERNPDSVAALLEAKQSARINAMILLEEAKRYKIVARHAGTWRIGGSEGAPIGGDDETCIEFIMDKANEEQVFLMQERIKESQPVTA